MNTTAFNTSPPGEPGSAAIDAEELEGGLNRAAALVRQFYEGLEGRRVASEASLTETVAAFEGTLGEHGVGLDAALQSVEDIVLPQAMAIPHPLYLGLINSSPLAGGIVAEAIVGALNNNAGSWTQSPPFSAAEHEVVRCFKGFMGLSAGAVGLVLPGGSYTALHALQLARDARLPQWRTGGARALSGDPRVYVSDASHFSAERSAVAIGVAEKDVVRVPSTGRGSIDTAALVAILREDTARGALPFALVATLGTTGTGAVDSLPELVAIAREFDLWLHVDACYGGGAVLLDEMSAHFEGLAEADSVAVDPHKWFYVPMVAGLLFTRHPESELRAFDVDAPYIPDSGRIDGFRRGLPTSRRCAGFAIWMALRAHGLNTVRDAVRLNIALARSFESKLEAAGFNVMPEGKLGIACARWEPAGMAPEEQDALQSKIAGAAVASGQTWFGTVTAQNKAWLRFTFASRFTREAHVDKLVALLRGLVAQ